MQITVHMKDASTIVASGVNLDVIHSPTDPRMIVVTNDGVIAYWIEAANFAYAQLS